MFVEYQSYKIFREVMNLRNNFYKGLQIKQRKKIAYVS